MASYCVQSWANVEQNCVLFRFLERSNFVTSARLKVNFLDFAISMKS